MLLAAIFYLSLVIIPWHETAIMFLLAFVMGYLIYIG